MNGVVTRGKGQGLQLAQTFDIVGRHNSSNTKIIKERVLKEKRREMFDRTREKIGGSDV